MIPAHALIPMIVMPTIIHMTAMKLKGDLKPDPARDFGHADQESHTSHDDNQPSNNTHDGYANSRQQWLLEPWAPDLSWQCFEARLVSQPECCATGAEKNPAFVPWAVVF